MGRKILVGVMLFLLVFSVVYFVSATYYGIDCKPLTDTDIKFMELISPNLHQPDLSDNEINFLNKLYSGAEKRCFR